MKTQKQLSRDELDYLIKTCLNFDLPEEAYEYMESLLMLDEAILSEDEMDIFSKSAKAKLNKYRNGRKNLLDFEQAEGENNYNSLPKSMIDKEMLNLEDKIKTFCFNIVSIVEKFEKNIEDNVQIIFYKKMKADYLRYYAEVSDGEDLNKFVELSRENYQFAYDKCLQLLQPDNPLTLSVTLNYSVFVYFLLDEIKQAITIAESVYKQALNLILNKTDKNAEVDSLMKSIEENLTIWKIESIDID